MQVELALFTSFRDFISCMLPRVFKVADVTNV